VPGIRKASLNCTIPELVNSKDGSFEGTNDDEGTIVWFFHSKYFKYAARSSVVDAPAALLVLAALMLKALVEEKIKLRSVDTCPN